MSKTVDVLYVVDLDSRPLDELGIRRFLLANLDDTVEQIMHHTMVSLPAFDDRDEAVRTMERQNVAELPVVDWAGIMA